MAKSAWPTICRCRSSSRGGRPHRDRVSGAGAGVIGLGVILAVLGLLIFSNAIHNYWPYDQPRPLAERSVARGEALRRRMGDEAAERFFMLRRRSLDRATRRAPIWIRG